MINSFPWPPTPHPPHPPQALVVALGCPARHMQPAQQPALVLQTTFRIKRTAQTARLAILPMKRRLLWHSSVWHRRRSWRRSPLLFVRDSQQSGSLEMAFTPAPP